MHPFSGLGRGPGGGPGGDQVRIQIHDHLKALFNIEDSSGIELFVTLQRAAHLSMLLDSQLGDDMELSAPRWRLLLRLLIEEQLGNSSGLTPTVLSRSQRVSKNTISALLRGLETQGLIQRTLDSTDLRAFHIKLTEQGREYLHNTAPRRLEALNHLLSGLTAQERETLTVLLEKLLHSLAEQCQHTQESSAALRPGSLNQESISR